MTDWNEVDYSSRKTAKVERRRPVISSVRLRNETLTQEIPVHGIPLPIGPPSASTLASPEVQTRVLPQAGPSANPASSNINHTRLHAEQGNLSLIDHPEKSMDQCPGPKMWKKSTKRVGSLARLIEGKMRVLDWTVRFISIVAPHLKNSERRQGSSNHSTSHPGWLSVLGASSPTVPASRASEDWNTFLSKASAHVGGDNPEKEQKEEEAWLTWNYDDQKVNRATRASQERRSPAYEGVRQEWISKEV